jgi:Uri superfamily endonuclease
MNGAQRSRRRDGVWARRGSYILIIALERDVYVRIGSLGACGLSAGIYAYVGSARRGIGSRVARHRRLIRLKRGALRWHIDTVLADRNASLLDVLPFPGVDECTLSRTIASQPGVEVPVRGFGSSDCTAGCSAHFYRLPVVHRPDIVRFAAALMMKLPRRSSEDA